MFKEPILNNSNLYAICIRKQMTNHGIHCHSQYIIIYRQPNKIMAYLTFHKWLVSVCNIHNDIMIGTNQNQSLGKSELRYYFIRLTIFNLINSNCMLSTEDQYQMAVSYMLMWCSPGSQLHLSQYVGLCVICCRDCDATCHLFYYNLYVVTFTNHAMFFPSLNLNSYFMYISWKMSWQFNQQA